MKFSNPIMVMAAGAVLTLSACTDPGRFDQTGGARNNTQTGAVIGGIAGALAGIMTSGDDDNIKGAVIGGAVGAGIGGTIGYRLDQQASDLRRELGNDQVNIVNTGSNLIVTMPQDILFPVDSATVRADLRRDLSALSGNLQKYSDTTVQIVGHTDNTGSAEYNQRLSQRRADAVSSILISNGIPSHRIQSVGRGEDAPISNNLTDAGRAQNRRVEVIITPRT